MLLDVVRKVVPIKYRQDIGLWTARQVVRSKLLLYPYFFILCGSIPKNIKLLSNDRCSATYKGHVMVAPRDGILAFWEIFQDEIYEKVYKPKKGDVVIDIGAYVGMFAVKMALCVGDSGKVIAIEPAVNNREYLYRNTENIKNIIVMPVALGASNGMGDLFISHDSPCHTLIERPHSHTEKVVINKLDTLLEQKHVDKVDFIKIDAEGYELEILKGATDTLMSSKPKLAIASYHNLPNGEGELPYVKQYLDKLGYKTKIVNLYIYASKD